MQATIFGYNIRILQNTLKMYHTYCITNAAVGQTPEKYHFLENKYQLAINARTLVEEIQIDGLTLRFMRYNFTPITATENIEATVFSKVASEFYSLTPAYIIDGQVLLPVLHKLSEPKECTITLKAHMYNYAGVSQIKFKVHSISTKDMTESQNRSETLLALPSNAANKKSKTTEHNASSSSFPAMDTPTVNSPTENSAATAEQTSETQNDNK